MGGILDIFGGDDPSPPPAPNYAPMQAASDHAVNVMAQVAREDRAFRERVYEESKAERKDLMSQITKTVEQQRDIERKAAIRSDEQYEDYRQRFRPAEEQMLADAYGRQNLNAQERAQLHDLLTNPSIRDDERQERLSALSDIAIERAAERSGATATAAVNNATSQQARLLGRFSVDPNRMAALARDYANTSALGIAGAQNSTRNAEQSRLMALRSGATAFGRGMPNTAGQMAGVALNAGNSLVNNANAGYASGLPYAQFQGAGTQYGMMPAELQAKNALGWGGIYSQNYGQMLNWSAATGGDAGAGMGGLGQMAGMFASSYFGGGKADGGVIGRSFRRRYADGGEVDGTHGGKVRGRGTGTSDSIRAINVDDGDHLAVSNGEYVLPADTVRKIGKEELDRIVRATHTPVRRRRPSAVYA
jgi:hypothetical protein